jgi:hydroxymethylglutaryl-CoA reductase
MNSRIPSFYNLKIEERRTELVKGGWLTSHDSEMLAGESEHSTELADHMIENVIGVHSMPLGIALNFVINHRDVLIPMVIEEPSVVAGASFMAKLVRAGGGFIAEASAPEMIGQMQVLNVSDLPAARLALLEKKKYILEEAAKSDPILQQLGGGPRDLEVRIIEHSPIGPFLVIHIIFDVRDAMGANTINTATEQLAPFVETITGGHVVLRILSNLADRRLARACCTVPLSELAFDQDESQAIHYSGEQVRDGIIAAWAFAATDPYRAATHNKGIMNGVDAVVLATGNDWRAVEAGAHAYAARSGKYTSLSNWSTDQDGNLVGTLEMPMAVGIVGGATKVFPTARIALHLMGFERDNGPKTASDLAEIIVSVGLAQNLAALRALVTEGIQHGHMSLHARQVAIAAGAEGAQIEKLTQQLRAEKMINIDRAETILKEWKKQVD